jgi:PAS domain S-box-containing protein
VDSGKTRVFLIEDNPGDARLIRGLLAEAGNSLFDLGHADCLSTGLKRLAEGGIDVLLLDLSLPDSQGLDSVSKVIAKAPKVPIVVMSGLEDESVAIKAVQEGAQDYLVKGSVDAKLLARSLRYAIERQHLREALSESESHYRLLADNAADVIWTANMKWMITYVSPSIKRLLGYTAEEIMKLTLKDILTPDSAEQARKAIRDQIEIRTPRSQYPPLVLTLAHVRKDGSTLWAEVMLSFLWDEDEKVSEVLGVTRDITQREKVEETLRQREQDYLILLESTHDSILVVDAETLKVVFGNRRAALMFGFDPVLHDVVGVNLLDFIHPEDKEIAIKGFVEDLYQRERRQRYDVRAKTKDGREIWVSALATKIEFQGRVAVLLSLRDVTKDRRMEEEKQRLEEGLLLAGRLAAIGELAAGIAHELNNPLAAIQGFAQLLTKSNDLNEATKKDLDIIYREAQRAARITQNLLSFARKHKPEKQLISINEALEKTLELRAHEMKANNIELSVQLQPDLPLTMVDFYQIQQVFMNIIINAEQAMVEAHGKGKLVIKTRTAGNSIEITFTDDGPGISEEDLNRIFDPFFTTKEVGKGTGLGLSLCHGIVQTHGGRIYAKSKLGKGATFVVEIPIMSEGQAVAERADLVHVKDV